MVDRPSTIGVAIVGTRFGAPDVEAARLAAFPVTLRLPPSDSEESLVQSVAEADLVLAGGAPRFTARVIAAMQRCRAIIRYGVGTDTIDLAAASAAGIQVVNVPDYATDEVATHTVALLLALARKLLPAHRAVVAGQWGLGAVRPLFSLAEQTIGVVGFGQIGRTVVNRLRPFGSRLLVADPFAAAGEIATAGATACSFSTSPIRRRRRRPGPHRMDPP